MERDRKTINYGGRDRMKEGERKRELRMEEIKRKEKIREKVTIRQKNRKSGEREMMGRGR